MKVLNIHERELYAGLTEVGTLLDSLASDKDALWPYDMWPRMKFDRPLGPGAEGGHGPIRYFVEDYKPGKSVRFRFTGPRGFNGYHVFDVISVKEGTTVLRHTLEMTTSGRAIFSWPLFFRPLHDALLEDSLTLAEASLGQISQVKPWSSWVRLLRYVVSGGEARPQTTPKWTARAG